MHEFIDLWLFRKQTNEAASADGGEYSKIALVDGCLIMCLPTTKSSLDASSKPTVFSARQRYVPSSALTRGLNATSPVTSFTVMRSSAVS